ncbi:MAG: hypothetical protein Q8922_00645 [Bacteroidota bacterium]|nr:hypothetical protein [Bacteroidota bacterium]MDP4232540.1 hypothetical protein [Bacteroidota bacterium]MDP4241675.1 hypothetical protein [Bacteroidota bacterium]MDP4286420.1 hypothetical protein [Bacteroidota bacterium]
MKRLLVAVFLLLGASLTASRAKAQVDSCLALYQNMTSMPKDSTIENPDSLRIDTCHPCHTNFGELPCTWYAKRTFLTIFKYYIFPDSIPPTGYGVVRQWWQIDSTFPEVRRHMQLIEQRFGHFDLQYRQMGSGWDTSSYLAKGWKFYFDQYVNVDSALGYIDSLPDLEVNLLGHVHVSFYDGLNTYFGGHSDVEQIPDRHSRTHAWPQPCSSELVLQGEGRIDIPDVLDLLGRHLAPPTRFEDDSTLHIDLTTVPSGILFLKLPQQVIKITVRK